MTSFRAMVMGVVIASLFVAGMARAEESGDDDESRVEHRWYGGQTLLADGVSLGLASSMLVTDYAEPTPALFATGMISYTLVPPIIHAAHGHVGKAFGDLGIRLGAATTGAAIGFLVGAAFWSPPPPVSAEPSPVVILVAPITTQLSLFEAQLRGAAVGTVIGGAVAAIIDGTALARDEVPRPGTRISDPHASVMPTVGPTPHGFNAGVTGTF